MATTTATRTRKPVSAKKAAKRAEYRKAVKAQMTQAADMIDSGDYTELTADDELAAFLSLTTHYSEGNAMLIMAQAAMLGLDVRSLSDVGGANAFADRGRVLDGYQPRLLFVWARITKVTDEDATAEDTKVETDEKGVKAFYRPVGLYHVSQTKEA